MTEGIHREISGTAMANTKAESGAEHPEHQGRSSNSSSTLSVNEENFAASGLEKGEENEMPHNATEAADPEAARTKLQTAIIMISLCSSVFLAALDTTIITTALPTISEHFNSSAGYTWIGSAYLLANAASTPSCKCKFA